MSRVPPYRRPEFKFRLYVGEHYNDNNRLYKDLEFVVGEDGTLNQLMSMSEWKKTSPFLNDVKDFRPGVINAVLSYFIGCINAKKYAVRDMQQTDQNYVWRDGIQRIDDLILSYTHTGISCDSECEFAYARLLCSHVDDSW